MEDKAQGGALDSSADSQRKKFEFSDDSNKPARSDEDSSVFRLRHTRSYLEATGAI